MKAALYARVSSEEQVEGYSIDAQKRSFQSLAKDKGWETYREYVDEGKSARTDNINKRPAFKEMIIDALDGRFDVVVVHKLDRFARNLRITLEYFDKLSKAGVSFVSINENMDFSTPWGRLALTLLGGLAQFYSDNLSQETKKGWHERREQGLYCGTLPFGAVKSEDSIPMPDMQERKIEVGGQEIVVHNYDGLKTAFKLAAKGESDREVAVALNTAGYRTTGTHGSRPFSKDTVKYMVTNKFYVGYISDGNGGWIKAKHEPFVEPTLFDEVQKMRALRKTNKLTVRADASVYSLSGIARCADCGSTLRSFKGRGRVRLACNGRLRGGQCTQPSTFLDIYEEQLVAYFKAFSIPDDYQEKILEAHRKLDQAYDVNKQRATLESRLQKLTELYEWGHKTKEKYLSEYAAVQRELQQLAPVESKKDVLEKLAIFLLDVASAWEQASQVQRNRLATCLLESVLIKDKKVVAVVPRPEFKPFFDLQYEGLSQGVLHWRPRGDLNPRSPP